MSAAGACDHLTSRTRTATTTRPSSPCCPSPFPYPSAPRPCIAVLARTGTPVDGDLKSAGRLAQADPDATSARADPPEGCNTG